MNTISFYITQTELVWNEVSLINQAKYNMIQEKVPRD